MTLLKFVSYQIHIQNTFWVKIFEKKLKEWKLDESAIPISGSLSITSNESLRELKNENKKENWIDSIPELPTFNLDSDSFYEKRNDEEISSLLSSKLNYGPNRSEKNIDTSNDPSKLKGTLIVFNTFKNFKEFNKREYFSALGKKIFDDIQSWKSETPDENLNLHDILNSFILLVYADLKKYQFYYYIGFPVWTFKKPVTVTLLKILANTDHKTSFSVQFKEKGESLRSYLAITGDSSSSVFSQKELSYSSLKCIPSDLWSHLYFLTNDLFHYSSSKNTLACGWKLRNFLIFLQILFHQPSARIILFKNGKHVTIDMSMSNEKAAFDNFVAFELSFPGPTLNQDDLILTGWNTDSQGKVQEHRIDLSFILDPYQIAKSSLYLNLELMKWRMMPSLDLEAIKNIKCLCFGSGTLGCNVARALLSWGITTITMVDSGIVSHSNPPKQSLFTFEDALGTDGKNNFKAATAAVALKRIYPLVQSEGINMTIPMPGHFIHNIEEMKQASIDIEKLINSHDVIFLLTDSRESRWLPTLLGCYHQKLIITIALGFDTFLAMRHGLLTDLEKKEINRPSMQANPKIDPDKERLSCYFCHDIIGPSDTFTNRSLDQQCTISRPGLSQIASGFGVEIMIAMLQSDRITSSISQAMDDSSMDSFNQLGNVPQQIRGSLFGFDQKLSRTPFFEQCTACSSPVLKAFEKEGHDFILRAIREPMILEKITGLDRLKEQLDEDMDLTETDAIKSWSAEESSSSSSFHSL